MKLLIVSTFSLVGIIVLSVSGNNFLSHYDFRIWLPPLERFQTLSKENQFYGIRHLKGNIWKRIEYNYDPAVRNANEWYPFPAITNLFASFSETVFEFSQLHDMQISPYYHESPVWMLHFYHPKGGLGRIDISYAYPAETNVFTGTETNILNIDPSPTIMVGSIWTSPDFRDPIFSESHISLNYPIQHDELESALNTHFELLKNMEKPAWDK